MSEDSIALNYLNHRADQVGSPADLDFEQVLEDMVGLAEVLAPDYLQAIKAGADRRVKWRSQTAYAARRGVRRRWRNTIAAYEKLLALSEEVHARALGNTVRWYKARHGERAGNAGATGKLLIGAELKSFILLTSHARACKTASEVAHLIAGGFEDGALARLRTLYEVAVIHFFLAVTPYEVCERYHSYSAIESLAHLKAEKRLSRPGKWTPERDQQLAEAQEEADEVIGLYGNSIRRPYEWARPMFPMHAGRITFADLDAYITDNGLRLIYLAANHGIHAGSYAMLGFFDPSKRYLNSTRASDEFDDFAFLLSSATRLMGVLNEVTCRQLATQTESLDELFCLNVIAEITENVNAQLNIDLGLEASG